VRGDRDGEERREQGRAEAEALHRTPDSKVDAEAECGAAVARTGPNVTRTERQGHAPGRRDVTGPARVPYGTVNRLLLVSLLLAAAAAAQRNSAKLTLADREVSVEYGVAPYAKHSLNDLPIGKEWPAGADEFTMLATKGLLRTGWGPAWRFGMNEASVLRTQLPLVSGDTVIPPGSYRISLHRKSEKELVLIVTDAGLALGNRMDLGLAGELLQAKTPAEKLTVEWAPAAAKGKKDPELETKLVARYGPNQLEIPLKVIGARGARLAGCQVDVFSYEAKWLEDRFEKKLATPWLSLKAAAAKKEKDSFNLVVSGDACSLLQMMSSPTDSFGFGVPVPPSQELATKGSVQAGKGNAAKANLEPEKCDRSAKGELTLRLLFGEVAATATIADATMKR
jgi:hypothetical protein